MIDAWICGFQAMMMLLLENFIILIAAACVRRLAIH